MTEIEHKKLVEEFRKAQDQINFLSDQLRRKPEIDLERKAAQREDVFLNTLKQIRQGI